MFIAVLISCHKETQKTGNSHINDDVMCQLYLLWCDFMLILVLPTSRILKTVWCKWYDGTCQHIMLEGSLLWLRNHITPSLVRCLNVIGIFLALLQIRPLY